MQLIDTNPEDSESLPGPSAAGPKQVEAGRVLDLPRGCSKTVALPGGREVALYNVNGEFYATENFCPHKGAPLAEGILCEHVIECGLHGWQLDVRTGECLTVPERILTYEVVVEDGLIRILW